MDKTKNLLVKCVLGGEKDSIFFLRLSNIVHK